MNMIRWRYRLLALAAGNLGALAWFLVVRPVWPVLLDFEGICATLLLFLAASAPPSLALMAMLSKRAPPSYPVSAFWGVGVGLFTYLAIASLLCIVFEMPLFATIDLLPSIGLKVAAPAGAIAGLAARAVLGCFKASGSRSCSNPLG
jgi:hypothetical protein